MPIFRPLGSRNCLCQNLLIVARNHFPSVKVIQKTINACGQIFGVPLLIDDYCHNLGQPRVVKNQNSTPPPHHWVLL